ncbi:MAG TPA: cupredoxin domain-containing protein [Pyrinomonadaceae bacterium]
MLALFSIVMGNLMKRFLSLNLILSLFFVFGAVSTNAKPKKIKTVRINISQAGYAPASVSVKKGQTVRLVFYRSDANNCGDELVFPAFDIRREIPVGKRVIMTLTPKRAGAISFACGMDMYRGKILVTN